MSLNKKSSCTITDVAIGFGMVTSDWHDKKNNQCEIIRINNLTILAIFKDIPQHCFPDSVDLNFKYSTKNLIFERMQNTFAKKILTYYNVLQIFLKLCLLHLNHFHIYICMQYLQSVFTINKYYIQKHQKTDYSIPTSVEPGVLEKLFQKILDKIKLQINEIDLKDCHSLHDKKKSDIFEILKATLTFNSIKTWISEHVMNMYTIK